MARQPYGFAVRVLAVIHTQLHKGVHLANQIDCVILSLFLRFLKFLLSLLLPRPWTCLALFLCSMIVTHCLSSCCRLDADYMCRLLE